MSVWLAIPLALLLLVLILVLASSIHFHFRVFRLGKDDRVEFDLKALYGLVKVHYELPKVIYESLLQGVKVKVEASGIAPVQKDTDKEGQVDKKTLSDWLDDAKKALKATRDLKGWLFDTLAHVRISKLDWSTDFSLGDAAATATAAGALWGLKWMLTGWFSRVVRLEHAPRLYVKPVFVDQAGFSTELVCAGKLSLAYVLYAGLKLLRKVSKAASGFRQWKELIAAARHRSFGKTTD
ncbi:DUF2953 domain-containing protein [Paenibacillus donghaensis]|uniref:DUF2953 domain-containing protein n=1 Tax=Paenibacillus donghaensis TaxID=414771 RepID=A0A2Z2K8M6_9BACL|nr:DUF2953 domain-containing protein [Paenibacillus donghaensis]ASA22966.1 hypothetical protein B9T62_20440 [Paenibacillus donghaensis]